MGGTNSNGLATALDIISDVLRRLDQRVSALEMDWEGRGSDSGPTQRLLSDLDERIRHMGDLPNKAPGGS